MLLLESDMFMDALNASATNKKEPRKRKRRTSGSKDGSNLNDASPPSTPTNAASSPNSEKKSVPMKFYQDTLDAEEEKDKISINEEEIQKSPVPDDDDNSKEKPDISEKERSTANGLKGVLTYHKKKGPKKSIRWKPDSELEDIQYFELDETERVNVTKPFTDLKHMERRNEREAFLKGRNLANADIMEEKTNWRPLIPLDTDGQIPVEHGKNSKEKDIQAIRQKGTLQPLYFHKAMIPDTPAEPDLETHPYQEHIIIPLDDVTGNQDNISDFRNMPWPEPKGNAPPSTPANINMAPIFTPNMPQFPNGFPNPQFAVPGFQGPPNMPTEWQNGMPPPHLMAQSNIPTGPMGTSPMPPVMPPNMPHAIMMAPENMMMTPDIFNGPNQMFPPVPPENFNMAQNMFPPNMNMVGPGMSGPEGMPGPGFRGPMRGRGSAGHWRGKGGPGTNWDGQQRGRGGIARGGRKAVCIYFQRKGSCRQGDNCSFLHPGVNCPY
ncbi:hypothetical protein EVAR_74523_1 [Eumeta japonica]|uniref:C3H1-type domain-containing protein n=1 Tax=Eumeta variegata TaxID=151549 RepID=A0A4C1TBJ8_EUMVA|nr:hypothetical protein EVAR_74523_1 [Eumeta japonica]